MLYRELGDTTEMVYCNYKALLHRTQNIIQVIIIELMMSEEVACNPGLDTE